MVILSMKIIGEFQCFSVIAIIWIYVPYYEWSNKLEQAKIPAMVSEEQIQKALARKKVGMPAIIPQSSTPAIAGSACFTEAEVQTYLSTHPFPDRSVSIVDGGSQTIQSIQFMTMKDARIITKSHEISSDPDAIVCLVTLYGPFSLSIGAPPPYLQLRGWRFPSIIDIVYEVFDGQTGNLLSSPIPARLIPSTVS
jgi:hypothetical protein